MRYAILGTNFLAQLAFFGCHSKFELFREPRLKSLDSCPTSGAPAELHDAHPGLVRCDVVHGVDDTSHELLDLKRRSLMIP